MAKSESESVADEERTRESTPFPPVIVEIPRTGEFGRRNADPVTELPRR